MTSQSKRVTLDLEMSGHKKLRTAAKTFGITQQELLALIVDLTLSNLDTIRPHAERFKKRKDAEVNKRADMHNKAMSLLAKMTPEQQEKLLSGQVNLDDLL